jgi:nucleoside-diphosphate-sugar epimerase
LEQRGSDVSLLITGVGLVGAQVARLEQEAGRTPVLFDVAPNRRALGDFVDLDKCVVIRGDLLNPLDLVAAVRNHGVTRIAHTAAYPNLTAGALVAPLAAVQVNILGTAHVLEVARVLGLERVVVCSSSAMYLMSGGDDSGAAGFEEAWPRPVSLYASTKQAAENMALNYATAYGLLTVCVRFATVFGPWATGGGGVGTTFMEDLLRAAARGEPVQIDPTPREWLYSKDAGLAVHLASWNDLAAPGVFNVGEGVAHPGQDLVEVISALFPGADVSQSAESLTASLGPPVTMPVMDPTRARSQLGFAPAYGLGDAFADYYNWMTTAPSQVPA